MNASFARQVRFACACAAGLAAVTFLSAPITSGVSLSFEPVGLLSAGAVEARVGLAPALSSSDFPVCHGSMSGAARTAMRLAQARTEVPKAEMQAASPASQFADTDPPLWDGLGSISYKITTANPQAQTYFDQGLRLTYAFNHGEAQRAFHKAQKLDPTCVMCFWGEALVLGPNINLPMQQDAVAPAFAAVQALESRRWLQLWCSAMPRRPKQTVRRSMRRMRPR
jgi:hypothetical protein